jgi:membrane-associated phospholipid phosphatase
MKRTFFILSALLSLGGSLCAADEAPTIKDILANIWGDQRAIITSPLRMDKQDAALWGLSALSFVVLLPEYDNHRALDEKLLDGIDRDDQAFGGFFKKLTYLGDGSVLFGASLATYGVSRVGRYDAAQRFSAHWIEALTDASIWATALKIIGGRNRPENTHPESEFHGPKSYFHNEGVFSSFPSGHATLAFATAAVMTRESDNNLWVGVPAYLVAGGVGFSRMYVEKHWLTDVIFGAVLGHSIGTLVENRRHKSDTHRAWRVVPAADRDSSSLALVYQW